MAINVNTVYQTVLTILNKEQRGYITPAEFNRIATLVQQEIFEQYFEDLNQQLRRPGYDEEYADRVENIEEKISLFRTYAKVPYYTGNPAGTIEPCFYLPEDVHRIGTLMYKDEQEIQLTNRGEYLRLNMSKLTRPSTNYPLYINESVITATETIDPVNGTTITLCEDCIRVFVYPSKITKDVSLSYIRKPKDVVWAYSTGSLGQYIYAPDAAAGVVPSGGSVDFEIDNQEQVEVIMRILMYSGVVIRDPEIVQSAAAQVQATEQNQKQ